MTRRVKGRGDILVNGVPLMLWRDPENPAMVEFTQSPVRVDDQFVKGDQVIEYRDWSGGMGYSRRDGAPPNGYSYVTNADTRFPGAVIPVGLVTERSLAGVANLSDVTTSFEMHRPNTDQDHLYVPSGERILKFTDGEPTGLSNFQHLGTGVIARSSVTFKQYAYIGVTSSSVLTKFIWRFNGDTGWSTCNTATVGATDEIELAELGTVYWEVAGVGNYYLVGAHYKEGYTSGVDLISYLYYYALATEPTANGATSPEVQWTNWSAGVPIGDTTYAVQKMVTTARTVFPLKVNGVHAVDEREYTPNLTPYWQNSIDFRNNGIDGVVFDGYLYATHHQGLDRVRLGDVTRQNEPNWCQPGAGMPIETPIYGTPTALLVYDGWLFCSIYNNADSYVCLAKDRRTIGVEGPGPMLWHGALVHLTGTRITHMRVSSLTGRPVLWIFSNASGVIKCHTVPLARSGSPLQELTQGTLAPTIPDYTWNTSFRLFMPAEHWERPSYVKRLRRIDVVADNLTASPERSYDLLTNSDFAGASYQNSLTYGTFQADVNQSPLQTVEPSSWTTGRNIALRVDATGQTTNPPILRAIRMHARVDVEKQTYRKYTIKLGDNVRLANGTLDKRDQGALFDALVALVGADKFVIVDEIGATKTVAIDGTVDSVYQEEPATKQWLRKVEVTLRVFS